MTRTTTEPADAHSGDGERGPLLSTGGRSAPAPLGRKSQGSLSSAICRLRPVVACTFSALGHRPVLQYEPLLLTSVARHNGPHHGGHLAGQRSCVACWLDGRGISRAQASVAKRAWQHRVVFESIFEMVSAWGPSGKKPWLRGVEKSVDAYTAAWVRRSAASDSVQMFVDELKSHNVPGAYTRPESRADLFLFFDSWEKGRPPDEVVNILKSRHAAQRRR